jgi:hypothetical protein
MLVEQIIQKSSVSLVASLSPPPASGKLCIVRNAQCSVAKVSVKLLLPDGTCFCVAVAFPVGFVVFIHAHADTRTPQSQPHGKRKARSARHTLAFCPPTLRQMLTNLIEQKVFMFSLRLSLRSFRRSLPAARY